MSNNYSTPSSTLVNNQGNAGSLEAAIAGDYEFGVMDTISEAWGKTKGIKCYIIGAGILLYVILGIVLGIVMAIMMPASMGDGEPDPFAMIGAQLVLQPIMFAVMMPFVGGIVVMCLKQIQGREVAFGDLFSVFNKTLPLFLAAILINILVSIGFLLLILPGIYLGVSYLLVVPLIVDRDLGVWEAMEASRKAITKRWFSVFGLYLLLLLIVLVSMIPLGIGLLWTIPLMAMAFMTMYQKMFGIASY